MLAAKSVLVVDPTDETRDVLRVALEHRGLRTLGARRLDEALALAGECQPDCVVFDLELESINCSETQLVDNFAARSPGRPLVLLGRAKLNDRSARPISNDGSSGLDTTRTTEFVAKPYHYAPLIRKIESLLARP